MRNVIIACEVLKDELEKVIQETICQYPIIWVESQYHIEPNKLRAKLQQEIDALEGVDNILFAYGNCGNGLVDLNATTANLIIPKTDDCISLFLTKPREKFQRMKKTYFLTKGWIDSSKSIMKEYTYTLNRYGPKRTERLFEVMLRNYQYLLLIDTDSYSMEDYTEKVREFAEKMKLELMVTKGDLWFLKKLLIGPYDENFCVIPKGQKVNLNNFGYEA
jgi:hypothetical protein